jgi:hypothetical protein
MANPLNLNVSSSVPRSSRACNRAGVVLTLQPLASRHEATLSEVNEEALRWNYDIPSSIQLSFQNPETRSIDGSDITLFQRMFMAGLRLPFSEIERDFILFLMVASSQVIPNAWRYLFASYILWKTVLRSEMSIRQFFNIYRPRQNSDGTVELTVRHPSIFIWLKNEYSNNKFWEQQVFRVSGNWDCSGSTVLPEDRRMPWDWRILRNRQLEIPALSDADRDEVDQITAWSAKWSKIKKFDDIDFDKLVTDTVMRDHLGYSIPENKTLLSIKGRAKKPEGAAPRDSRKPVQKRPAEIETTVMERMAKKKKAIPLAACPPRRVPPMRDAKQPIESISREEMSEGEFEDVFADIEGYVPENTLVRETVILPSFRSVDEETLGHSPVQSLNSP